MRTIKFRLVKDGKIVGYEKHDFYQGPAQVCIMHSKDGNSWKNVAVGWGDAWIDHDHKDQYIGAKDKIGKEIYEGDTASGDPDKIKSVVTWNEWICAFGLLSGNGVYLYPGPSVYMWDDIEVIGNTYQDNHLLTEGGK